MALLGDPVLVTLVRVDAGGVQVMVVQQDGVGIVGLSAPAAAYLLGGGVRQIFYNLSFTFLRLVFIREFWKSNESSTGSIVSPRFQLLSHRFTGGLCR